MLQLAFVHPGTKRIINLINCAIIGLSIFKDFYQSLASLDQKFCFLKVLRELVCWVANIKSLKFKLTIKTRNIFLAFGQKASSSFIFSSANMCYQ